MMATVMGTPVGHSRLGYAGTGEKAPQGSGAAQAPSCVMDLCKIADTLWEVDDENPGRPSAPGFMDSWASTRSITSENPDLPEPEQPSPAALAPIRRLLSSMCHVEAKANVLVEKPMDTPVQEIETFGKITMQELLKYRSHCKGTVDGQCLHIKTIAVGNPVKPTKPVAKPLKKPLSSPGGLAGIVRDAGLPVVEERLRGPLSDSLGQVQSNPDPAAFLPPAGELLSQLRMWASRGPRAATQATTTAAPNPLTVGRKAAISSVMEHDDSFRALSDIDSDQEDGYISEPGESADVLVGPTYLAVQPMKLEELSLPESAGKNGSIRKVPLGSNSRCLSFSDAMRLARLRQGEAPLSFGSTLHVNFGPGQPCRPCMFERWAGRCDKSWLCDFCHLHTVHKRRADGTQRTRNRGQANTLRRRPKPM
mmetsp:Transcript_59749/g.165165  ORF Transcript_59749/g.165165 Transcript_59749/m.165165 type:complete len:422 (+) Transcript_59749:95-1360(+)